MNLGASSIATLKLGSQQVSRVMLGGVEVWANMDPDAAAYIAAIEGDGIAVSATQKSALDAFYKAGKSDGWYSALKRMYLPIWAAATPNARCMVSGTSGSFVGTVAHEAGYVQGGGTGYCDTGSTCATLGITRTDAYGCFLAKTQLAGAAMGARNSVNQQFGMQRGATTALWSQIMTNATSGGGLHVVSLGDGNFNGVISHGNLPSGRFASRRTAASRGEYLTAHTQAGTPPTLAIYLMAQNLVDGTPNLLSTTEFGAFMIGAGITAEQDTLCTLALKTLWETCTGLSLP
jgi:hypothetical protein